MVVLAAACGGDDDGVSRLIGARCDTPSDCDDRCLTPQNDFPDGLCTLDCQSSNDCPSSSTCADKEGGICLFECNFAADCSFLGAAWICAEQNRREDQNQKVKVCVGG